MLISVIGALASVIALAGPGPLPHYRLAVRLDPAAHTLAVQGRLEGRPCAADAQLYLNQSFKLQSLKVGGRAVAAVFDTAAKPAQFTDATRPLVFQCQAGALEFAYRGAITDTIGGVNMLAPGLVELALYSGWYPRDPSVALFTYDMDLDLPRGWAVAAGGPARRTPAARGRDVVHISSSGPGMDIPLIASPLLEVQRAGAGAAAVEVYAVHADSALAANTIADLRSALALYESWYGKAAPAGPNAVPIRVVMSPRGGWGYSRLPLIVGPAVVLREWSKKPLGRALNVQGAGHELAHFWWRIADTRTDDWINEGLAEYSAFTAVSEMLGPQVRDTLVAAYRKQIARVTSHTSVAATTSEMRERYINHYEKPTLLFASVQATVGAPRFRDFLRAFYAAHVSRRDATTAAFMEAARAALGDAEGARIQRCITGEWTAECAPATPAPAAAAGTH